MLVLQLPQGHKWTGQEEDALLEPMGCSWHLLCSQILLLFLRLPEAPYLALAFFPSTPPALKEESEASSEPGT